MPSLGATLTGEQPLTQAHTEALSDALATTRQAHDISEWMRPTVWRIPAYIRWRRTHQPVDIYDTLSEPS